MRTKAYLFGVIIDCTEPFKSKEKLKYASKIKIIDPSFNCLEESFNPEIKFNRFATIYIYSNDENNTPKPKKVGDIIRLRRFNFVVSEKGELIGHQQKYSNWLIYDADDTSNTVISCQSISKNVGRVLTQSEAGLIQSVRNWSFNFFGSNSMYQIAWWTGLKEPMIPHLAVKNKEKVSEVDLMLKTEEVDEQLKRIKFRDHKQNIYFLILNSAAVLNPGDVIKLKCVDVFFTKDGRYLRLTPSTSCLSLLPCSFDYKLFNKVNPEEDLSMLKISHPFKFFEDEENYYNTKKKVLTKFPFLKNYDFEHLLINEKYLSLEEKSSNMVCSQLSLIHKRYTNKAPIPLSFLRNMLIDPINNELSQFVFQRFVIRAYLKEIQNKTPSSFIKKHCTKCLQNRDFNTKEFECCQKLMELYFHLVFMVSDKDEETGLDIEVPVYVVVSKTDHLFDLWELIPQPGNYKGFLEWDTVDVFNHKMEQLIGNKGEIELLVEVRQTIDQKPFLKLVDTLLLP